MTPQAFFAKAVPLAIASGHLFPTYACCEAAEESAWGDSKLAEQANNLFGQKQGHTTANLPVLLMPTVEYVGGRRETTLAGFVKFEDWAASFAARMALLRALAAERTDAGACAYPGYAAALAAANGPDFVTQVSRDWSTDPHRAATVLAIHDAYAPLLEQLAAPAPEGQ